jgi:hypothetical protein
VAAGAFLWSAGNRRPKPHSLTGGPKEQDAGAVDGAPCGAPLMPAVDVPDSPTSTNSHPRGALPIIRAYLTSGVAGLGSRPAGRQGVSCIGLADPVSTEPRRPRSPAPAPSPGSLEDLPPEGCTVWMVETDETDVRRADLARAGGQGHAQRVGLVPRVERRQRIGHRSSERIRVPSFGLARAHFGRTGPLRSRPLVRSGPLDDARAEQSLCPARASGARPSSRRWGRGTGSQPDARPIMSAPPASGR